MTRKHITDSTVSYRVSTLSGPIPPNTIWWRIRKISPSQSMAEEEKGEFWDKNRSVMGRKLDYGRYPAVYLRRQIGCRPHLGHLAVECATARLIKRIGLISWTEPATNPARGTKLGQARICYGITILGSQLGFDGSSLICDGWLTRKLATFSYIVNISAAPSYVTHLNIWRLYAPLTLNWTNK